MRWIAAKLQLLAIRGKEIQILAKNSGSEVSFTHNSWYTKSKFTLTLVSSPPDFDYVTRLTRRSCLFHAWSFHGHTRRGETPSRVSRTRLRQGKSHDPGRGWQDGRVANAVQGDGARSATIGQWQFAHADQQHEYCRDDTSEESRLGIHVATESWLHGQDRDPCVSAPGQWPHDDCRERQRPDHRS